MLKPKAKRIKLAGALETKLFFSQVREDAELELTVLGPISGKKIACVSSGGCIALSFLHQGAEEVHAIDLSETQNHLVELKAVALDALPREEAIQFLGGWEDSAKNRKEVFQRIENKLSDEARGYWNRNLRMIGKGVLRAGVTEKFLSLISWVIRNFIHSKEKITRFLSLDDLSEQVYFYQNVWNSWRWKALFRLLLNRFVFNKTYHPSFFEKVENPSFSKHFYELAQKGMTQIPAKQNYFLHQILTGYFAKNGALPRYLEPSPMVIGLGARKSFSSRLILVSATYQAYLKQLPDSSMDGFTLSNICEWMSEADIEDMFKEISRTGKPGSKVVFRNFVGWTDLPKSIAKDFQFDESYGNKLMSTERSLMQRRIVVADVKKSDSLKAAAHA